MNRATIVISFLLFVVVGMNIYASQRYSRDLFAILIDRDQSTALRILATSQGNLNSAESKLFLTNYLEMDYDSYIEINKYRESRRIKNIESTLSINPLHPAILNLLAQKYEHEGSLKKAQIMHDKAHQIDPINY